MNGLHPCTLPQRVPFAAVSRVSPLCAVLRPGCGCVRKSATNPHVAPTCTKNTKSQSSNAIAILRGGAAEWTRPAACGGARDMELVPTREPASHLASRRKPASCQMPQIGQKPVPTLHKRRIYDKGQTIQHSNLKTGFRSDTPKSGSGAHEPERLCNQLLSGQENHHS